MESIFLKYRKDFHNLIIKDLIRIEKGSPNFSDKSNRGSVNIANYIVQAINSDNLELSQDSITGQAVGNIFEDLTINFIKTCFDHLGHLRPGSFQFQTANTIISNFSQYAHLAELNNLVKEYKTLSSIIGLDYLITPDIVISRFPVADQDINAKEILVINTDHQVSSYTPYRETNNRIPIMHASISCKWTIRSDRSQNTRTEALNLIRNRKGNTPHISVVTAEPLPSRIASLALGTGDLDCVYHFALFELIDAVEKTGNQDQTEILTNLVQGKRLRDISDLVFDLIV